MLEKPELINESPFDDGWIFRMSVDDEDTLADLMDEDDYGDREFEATLENIEDAAWKLQDGFDLPHDWVSQVYSWLSENRCGEIDNVDDLGGYSSESALLEAFEALGFEPAKDSAIK